MGSDGKTKRFVRLGGFFSSSRCEKQKPRLFSKLRFLAARARAFGSPRAAPTRHFALKTRQRWRGAALYMYTFTLFVTIAPSALLLFRRSHDFCYCCCCVCTCAYVLGIFGGFHASCCVRRERVTRELLQWLGLALPRFFRLFSRSANHRLLCLLQKVPRCHSYRFCCC